MCKPVKDFCVQLVNCKLYLLAELVGPAVSSVPEVPPPAEHGGQRVPHEEEAAPVEAGHVLHTVLGELPRQALVRQGVLLLVRTN